MQYQFEFLLEGISAEKAEKLMELFVLLVEKGGGTVAGGCWPVEEKDGQVKTGE